MQIGAVQLNEWEVTVVALLSAIILLLLVVVWLFGKRHSQYLEAKFKELGFQSDSRSIEQAQHNKDLQENFQQTRTALLETQGNIQSKMEQRLGEVQNSLEKRLGEMSQASVERLAKSSEDMQQSLQQQLQSLQKIKSDFEQRFGDMQNSIEKRLGEMSKSSIESFVKSNNELHELLQKRLAEISGQVEKRLDKGFEKTTETFTDVVKRLAMIDEAQKRITELSSNVVSLQEVLTDKRSRGAFGEVQMAALISNVMPEGSYKLQYS